MFTEKQLTHERVFEGIIVEVYHDKVELPNGKITRREVCTHGGAALILPICGDEILFVSQYRYAIGQELLELPAGKRELGEEHSTTATRELCEETGMACKSMEYMGEIYSSPGILSEVLHVYCARELTFVGGTPDEDEFLSCRRVKIDAAFKMIASGEIRDSKTICALAMAREKGFI